MAPTSDNSPILMGGPLGRITHGIEQYGAMRDPETRYRFYEDLARWWPLISPPGEYTEEAAFAATLFAGALGPVRDVLELGSGGGHNALHLKQRFAMTLVDLSDEMLDVSRVLNPECEHRQGDMRTIRLEREFDAVFVHDAVDYMATEHDLRLAMETAFVHCRPGGIVVFMPDDIKETFKEGTDHGGNDAEDGRGVRYLEWDWDPDPKDTWRTTEYAFLLREVDGSIEVVHETHRTGLFGRDVWLRLLSEVGFDSEAVREETTENRNPRELFVGRRQLPSL
jgi:SAM-dependent methyltransferase